MSFDVNSFVVRSSHIPRVLMFVCAYSGVIFNASNWASAAPPDVLELLELHCVKCHGGAETKGGLDLTTRDALLRGGESGPAIVADDANASLFLQTIRHELDPHMPYKQPKLSDEAIKAFTDWIKGGFPYSRSINKTSPGKKTEQSFAITDADRNHWAFLPIRPERPPLALSSESPVDAFIRLRLATQGLTFAPQASKTGLIRRVTLDLIGLPPTIDEIDAFLNDDSPCAYERLIDRLLASPHYGERWGRHWLDLARYAETDGFEHDAVRPHSWRYRDYVITSFNDDKPYDRFICEQLAGDELWPDDPAALTATGFNLLGPDMVDSSDQIQRRHNTLNDMTDTTALTFLGLTIGCARCHDHKFEPISQRDYYRLQAYFTPTRFDREKAIPTAQILAAHEAAVWEFNLHPTLQELAALEVPVRDRLLEKKIASLSSEAQIAHRTPAEQRNAEQANLVLETSGQVKITDKELAAALSNEERDRHAQLKNEVNKLPKPIPLPKAMALAGSPASKTKTHVLNRGEYSQPGEEVAASVPQVLQKTSGAPLGHHTERATEFLGHSLVSDRDLPANSSRTSLARWMTSLDNPLTARVAVNRIWQHHFGRGLVATPSDFGTHGLPPSHPELLDWLASEFASGGWSIKRMHRMLLISGTYRQVSGLSPSANQNANAPGFAAWKAATRVDPDNRLYWRANRLRLEGEVIRDSLLAVSGRLNQTMSGPGVFPPIPKELFAGAKGWETSKSTSEHARRSIYIFARRNLRFPFLEVFDAPDSNLSCPIREQSVTAPQSLTLLNADEVVAAAKATTQILKSDGRLVDQQITFAYRLVLGRTPTGRERLLARQFLAESPLEEFCRALFNLNEFIYAE